MHSAEKACDNTLDDEKLSLQHNSVVITFTRGRHIQANKRACALDLGDTSHITCNIGALSTGSRQSTVSRHIHSLTGLLAYWPSPLKIMR